MMSERKTNSILPPDALAYVLQFVPLQPRLCSCAVVCKAWQAAACTATTKVLDDTCHVCLSYYHLNDKKLNQEQANALTAWLQKHGSTVACMHIGGNQDDKPLVDLQFPCHSVLKQLQSLNLRYFNILCSSSSGRGGRGGSGSIDGSSSSSSSSSSNGGNTASTTTVAQADAVSSALSAPAAALASLTSLLLENCIIGTALGVGLSQLAALTNLRKLTLDLGQIVPAAATAEAAQAHIAAFGNTFGQLKHLTRLELSCGVDHPALAALSKLQQLQEIQLGYAGEARNIISINLLPCSLKVLEIIGHWQFTCRNVPSYWQLTALQKLMLSNAGSFEPAVLAHMQQLQSLEVEDVYALSPPGAAGVRALLSVLPQLQQLQHMHIDGSLRPALPEAESHLYQSFMSSNQLTCVDLQYAELPARAARLLLSAGCQRPALQYLLLGVDSITLQCYSDDRMTSSEAVVYHPECLVAVRDVVQLASCCPCLKELGTLFLEAAGSTAQPGADASAAAATGAAAATTAVTASLLQLTALTELSIGGDGVDDSFAEQVLAQLTQLQHLSLSFADSLTESGLVHLTRLTQLQQLNLCSCPSIFPEPDGSCGVSLTHEPGALVWQQLVEKCRTSPAAAQVMLRHRDSQLQQQGVELAAAQQEVLQLREQLAATEQQLQQKEALLAAAHGRAA